MSPSEKQIVKMTLTMSEYIKTEVILYNLLAMLMVD